MTECELCDNTTNIDEHHTSYDPEETVMLCRSCHQKVHGDPDHPLHPNDSPETTVIEVTSEQREYLREEMEPRSAKASLQMLIDAYEGRGKVTSEGRVREIVRDEVRMEALE